MKATKVNAGLAESNGRLLLGIWRDSLQVTCGLTACTLGSVPGPTLGNEYGKTLPFTSAVARLPRQRGKLPPYGWTSKNYVICVCTAVNVSASGGLRTLDPL